MLLPRTNRVRNCIFTKYLVEFHVFILEINKCLLLEHNIKMLKKSISYTKFKQKIEVTKFMSKKSWKLKKSHK